MHSLWQDISLHTRSFDLFTLILKFDQLFKNFNLGHNFQSRRARAFILHICIPCDKDLSHHSFIFDIVTLTLKFYLLLKNFYIGHYFMNREREGFHISYINTCIFLVTKPFTPYHTFSPNDLELSLEHSLNVAILIWLPLGELRCLLTTLVKRICFVKICRKTLQITQNYAELGFVVTRNIKIANIQ